MDDTHIRLSRYSDKLEICRDVCQWYAGGKRDAARAPLCKGSCREATEGLCSTVLQFRKCFGEKAGGNDFAVESSVFDGTSAKRGQNGHGTFGRWAHREVHHYNPSVSFAASSPYTGEPLGVRHPPAYHCPNSFANSKFAQDKTTPGGSGQKQIQTKGITVCLRRCRREP